MLDPYEYDATVGSVPNDAWVHLGVTYDYSTGGFTVCKTTQSIQYFLYFILKSSVWRNCDFFTKMVCKLEMRSILEQKTLDSIYYTSPGYWSDGDHSGPSVLKCDCHLAHIEVYSRAFYICGSCDCHAEAHPCSRMSSFPTWIKIARFIFRNYNVTFSKFSFQMANLKLALPVPHEQMLVRGWNCLQHCSSGGSTQKQSFLLLNMESIAWILTYQLRIDLWLPVLIFRTLSEKIIPFPASSESFSVSDHLIWIQRASWKWEMSLISRLGFVV